MYYTRGEKIDGAGASRESPLIRNVYILIFHESRYIEVCSAVRGSLLMKAREMDLNGARARVCFISVLHDARPGVLCKGRGRVACLMLYDVDYAVFFGGGRQSLVGLGF